MRPSNLSTKVRSANATDVKDLDDPSLGTAGSRQISVFDEHAQFRNALAPRGGVAFDGSNSAGALLATLTNQNIGTDPFSISMVVSVPATTPSVSQGLLCLSAQNNNFTAQSFDVSFGTSGLDIAIRGASTSDYNRYLWNFYSLYAGKTIHLILVRPATGSLFVYVNGIDCTSLVSASSNGTPPGWQGSITSTYFQVGNRNASSFVGKILTVTLYNLALSATDVIEIFELGGAVPERFKWGSQAALYTSDYSGGTDSWAADNPPELVGNVDGINGQNDWLSANRSASVAQLYSRRSDAAFFTTPGQGKAWRLRARIYNPASSPFSYFVAFLNNGVTTTPVANCPAGAQIDYDAVAIHLPGSTGDQNLWGFKVVNFAGAQINVAPGNPFYQKNAILSRVGAMVHLPLDEGAGYQLRDASSNKLDVVMSTAGVAHVLPQHRATVRTTLVFSGAGNLQMLGQAAIDTSRRWRISSFGGNSSAAVSLSLGSASGSAQYIATQAVPAGDFDIATFVSRLISGANLWVNSSGSATITLVVNLEALD